MMTRLSGQPNAVHDIWGKAQTQDVLVLSVCHDSTSFKLLTKYIHTLPCIIMAVADTSSSLAGQKKKMKALMKDMNSYKRGFTTCDNIGLFLNGCFLYILPSSECKAENLDLIVLKHFKEYKQHLLK